MLILEEGEKGKFGSNKKTERERLMMIKRGRGRPRKTNIESPNSDYVNLSNGEVPYSDNLPEFFKIYTPTLSSTVMRIPPDFIDEFGGSVPTTCTLKTPLGSSRLVSINRVNDDLFFQEGWSKFVEENSLQDREFLTFCYVGKSTFLVKIFSVNGCPKVASHTSRIDRIDDETPDCESEKSEIVQTKRRKPDPRWGGTCSLKDGKPCFTIKMMKGYVERRAMRLPMDFWRDHMKKNKKSRTATLWVGNDKWSVDLGISYDRILFQKGIVEFIKDNSIKVGASCTFQLIDLNTLSFKVTFTNTSS